MSRGMRRREARGTHWNEAQCMRDFGVKTKREESDWKIYE